MIEHEIDELRNAIGTLKRGMSCALRVMALPDGTNGITKENKLNCVAEVLRVAAARADGDQNMTVSDGAMLVLSAVMADVEFAILSCKLGIIKPGAKHHSRLVSNIQARGLLEKHFPQQPVLTCDSVKPGEYYMLRCVLPQGHAGDHAYAVDPAHQRKRDAA